MSTSFTIARAETSADREKIFRLRYQVFCEEYQYLDKWNYPDGLERDAWDDYSTHFMAMNAEGEVVATSRLIADSPLGLRVEEYAPLPSLPREKMFEVSRLAMRADLRGHGNDIILGLSKAMFNYSQRAEVGHWVGTMFLGTWKLYLHFGFQFTITGQPSFWPKHTTNAIVPVAFDLERTQILLRTRNPKLCQVFYPSSRFEVQPEDTAAVLREVASDLKTVNTFKSMSLPRHIHTRPTPRPEASRRRLEVASERA